MAIKNKPGDLYVSRKTGEVHKCSAEVEHTKSYKLLPMKSVSFENTNLSEEDEDILNTHSTFTIEVCGDTFTNVRKAVDPTYGTIQIGDVSAYGICIFINTEGVFSFVKNPKKYAKDLTAKYELNLFAEDTQTKISYDWKPVDTGKNYASPLLQKALENSDIIEDNGDSFHTKVDDIGSLGGSNVTEPYVEETYGRSETDIYSFGLISATLHGHTFVRQYMFYNQILKNVYLPDTLGSIDENAFENCSHLALTSLPEGLKSIGSSAFKNCRSLALTSLPAGLTRIQYNAFENCESLALTSLPEGVEYIYDEAFRACTSLALTSLPEGLKSIGTRAFQACTSLALTSLPESLKSIGKNVFYGCTSLALTSLPEGITGIGGNAFSKCTSLALTSLPEGLKSIQEFAFSNCTGLTSIVFKGTPDSIASSVFQDCTNLTEIKVPWAEGTVANAPWGATNATITYNYTESA